MRCFDKVLYHGTSPDNVKGIMENGLEPRYLGNSIICMSPKPEIAKNFGAVVLEVSVDGYEMSCFDDCVEWERFVWTMTPIPLDRIKEFRFGC